MSETSPRSAHGAIVLVRHGEPALSRKVRLNAQEYRDFWSRYEELGIAPGQTPPAALVEVVRRAGVVVSSVRLRAVESVQALAPGRDCVADAVYVEAPLPPPRLPAWFRMTPKMWGFWARFWWWFFNHHEGQETRAEASVRADQAADWLIDHASRGEDVILVAHGFFNHMIGWALQRRGWKLVDNQGFRYWAAKRFEPRHPARGPQ